MVGTLQRTLLHAGLHASDKPAEARQVHAAEAAIAS
jgi:hypothetical protein